MHIILPFFVQFWYVNFRYRIQVYICVEKISNQGATGHIGRKSFLFSPVIYKSFSYSYPCIYQKIVFVYLLILWPCIPEMPFCAVLRTSRGRIGVRTSSPTVQGCGSVAGPPVGKYTWYNQEVPIYLVGPFLGPQPWQYKAASW